jgi:pyridoxal phosphate enzyme (YggS family)
MVVDIGVVGDRLVELRRRLAAAGGDDVTVVAVTKGFGPEVVEAAVAVGLDDIGENYAQELLTKLTGFGEDRPRVHFIGRLQSNKARSLAGVVDLWQSVDRPSLVEPLSRLRPPARVLVQVNVSDEPGKGGCAPSEVAALVARLREGEVVVEGLIAVGRTGPPESARPGFRLLRTLADDLGLATCSMGMTDDLEVAVEEGSTMVRVGSALFGPRPSTRARAN